MLHAEVRRLDQFVAVRIPGVRSEPVLEAFEHRDDLSELALRGVRVIVERPEVERQTPRLTIQRVAEVRVSAGIDRDVVVVDRTGHKPFVRRRAVRILRGLAQPAVRDVEQWSGHGDRDSLAVGLIRQVVLGRPPDARAEPLVGGRDPLPAQAVFGECEPAIPGKPPADSRLTVIPHGDRPGGPGARLRLERDEERIAVAPVRELAPVLHDAVDLQRHLQIDLHFARGLKHAIRDRIPTADRRVGGIHPSVQIVELHVPPGAPGSVGASERVGVAVVCGVLRLRQHRASQSREQEHRCLCHCLRSCSKVMFRIG